MRYRAGALVGAWCVLALAGAHPAPAGPNRGEQDMGSLPTASGEWWNFRGDWRLTGRSAARGAIQTPAVRWKHEIASRQTLLEVRFTPGRNTCALPPADMNPTGLEWARILGDWGTGFQWRDLDETGTLSLAPPGFNQKVGKILANEPGLQMITAETKNYPVREPYLGTVRLKVRKDGQWVPKWETDTDTLLWVSEPIYGDFDRDGRMEVALLPWYKLNVLDAETGRLKDQGRFLEEEEIPGLGGRAYGWFGAFDLDGQGPDEFVIIDDFIQHMEVLAWRDGRLQRLWMHSPRSKKLEGGVPAPDDRVSMLVNPEPVQDVDGDGRREIVVSICNATGDQRWHVLVIDGITGKTKVDLAGEALIGLRDANGDGIPELFCAVGEDGSRVPDPSTLRIRSLKGGRCAVLWELREAAFETYGLPDFPSNVNSAVALGNRTVLCLPVEPDGSSVFFTRRSVGRRQGEAELTAWEMARSNKVHTLGRLRGPRLQAMAVRAAGGGSVRALVQATAFQGEPAAVRCERAQASPLVSRRLPGPVSPVVVAHLKPRARPVVLIEGANESVEAFRPTADGGSRRVWRVAGRGMTCANYPEGVLVANLTGDGRRTVLVGTRGDGNCARLSALTPEGKLLWYRDFPRYPGDPPPWNVAGLLYWQAGYFTSRDRMDVIAQLRTRGEETYLLDGRTGKILWRLGKGREGRAFGGAWMTLFDYDGDGLDDIYNAYPDMFCVAKGSTGELLVAREAREFVPGGGYWGRYIVADLQGTGHPQILYAGRDAMALLGPHGESLWKGPLWHGANEGRQTALPAIGDADGDGRLELFMPSVPEAGGRQMQCWDAATGALKWGVPMPPEEPTAPAAADINGDGRDECVITVGRTLYAFAAAPDGKSGRLLWALQMPGRVGPVAIADVEGDGTAQIVLTCDDGHVYGIGPAE